MQSRCMCGASVYELDFGFCFFFPSSLPKSSFFGLILSAVNRGIECSLLEPRPPTLSEDATIESEGACGLARLWCHCVLHLFGG